jgi:hypothetical protein
MSSGLYLRAAFERFRGTLYPDNGKVEFEGMIFNSAHQAVQILKELSEYDQILSSFMFQGQRGFELDGGRIITVSSDGTVRTFSCNLSARVCITALKKKGKL